EDGEYRRGFVASVGATAKELLEDGEKFLSVVPLEKVGLRAKPDELEELARWPHLARLHTLKMLGQSVGAAGARALAGCPHLGNLRGLELVWSELDDDGVQELARSPHLRGLRTLNLEHSRVGP